YTWSLIRGNDGKDGKDGHDGIAGKDGNGIKTTVITYAISTSGTIAPTTGWTSSVPSLVKGQYLWTKTVWTYTDNSSETGYSVTYIAKDGNNGNDGIAGKDGVGIKTTTITYAGSTSGTTAPASGWTSTVPTVAAGSYLWTKTVWAYTDNTSETGYSVAKMGNNGATGPQGPQGNTGPQGPAGSNGNPGKIVSDIEPTTRFKGLTWKYLGTSDLTA
ncbi:collagen-like protein, partial [Lactococcus lactis]|uniref:collagen-like triple helix repeat-containing protein n=1 Tax=Lactococcus lactis TaxID=1358 RepID=UPI0020743991